MLLYLLRHAEAEAAAESDDARRLTEKGVEQAEKVSRFLLTHDARVSIVLTSPAVRARQTAEIVAEKLGAELAPAQWLACGMQPENALKEMHAHRSRTSMMLAGHEPDLSSLASLLLGIPSPAQLRVRKASLHLFNLPVLRAGVATLEFSIPCKLM